MADLAKNTQPQGSPRAVQSLRNGGKSHWRYYNAGRERSTGSRTEICTQVSGCALRLARWGTFGHVSRLHPPVVRPAPPSPALPPSFSPSLPLPPRPGPAHPPPRRLAEALPGRAAGGRAPTAGQTDAREHGRTDSRRAAGTHGPGPCSEARPGGLGPRSGEVTATRPRKGWAHRASAGPAGLAMLQGGAAWARRGKMAPGARGAPLLCGPGREPPRPPAVLVSPSPCWGAGPGPAGGGAGGSGVPAAAGECAGHGVSGAEGVQGWLGSLHGVALLGRGTGQEPDVGSWPGSRTRDTGSKRNWDWVPWDLGGGGVVQDLGLG